LDVIVAPAAVAAAAGTSESGTAAAAAVATGGTAYVTCASRSFDNGMGKWPSLFCRRGVNEEHGIGNNQNTPASTNSKSCS